MTHHVCVSLSTFSHSILLLDGDELISTFDLYECPEDATIARDIPHCSEINAVIQRVMKLVEKGDTVSFDDIYCDSVDEFKQKYFDITGQKWW